MDSSLFAEFDLEAARRMLEARWRGDSEIILHFAGALMMAGNCRGPEAAIEKARECWFSLLADETLGQRAVSAPDTRAIAGLRLPLPPNGDRP